MLLDPKTNLNTTFQTNFLMSFDRVPVTSFTCQKAQIPGLTLGTVNSSFATGFFTMPGENVAYSTLNLQCYMTEDFQNYLELHNWIRGISVSDGYENREAYLAANGREVTDATLSITSNALKYQFDVRFESLFPTSIDTIDFDVTIENPIPIVFNATFNYVRYEIIRK